MSKDDNRKKRIMLSVAGTLLTVSAIVYIFPKPDIKSKIETLREQTAPRFDSLAIKINQENNFYGNINRLIQFNNIELANKLIDSAINDDPNKSMLRTLKGMAFFQENKFNEAIQEYNIAMQMDQIEYPLTLSKRAEALTKLKNYEAALNDYKKAATSNHDFNFQIAETYEKMGIMDSAVNYYSKFLSDYPDKKEVRDHIDHLTSIKK